MKLIKVDKDGYFIEDVILEKVPQITEENEEGNLIKINDPLYINKEAIGFYLPKFNFETNEWVEGKPQDEIDEILNAPKPKTELELMQEAIDFLIMGGM